VLASIASGWLAEASIWSNHKATDGRCLDFAQRQAVRIRVYERREAALEASGRRSGLSERGSRCLPDRSCFQADCEHVAVKPHMLALDEEQVPKWELDGLSLARSNQEPCGSGANRV
jgi:hypothetical protein